MRRFVPLLTLVFLLPLLSSGPARAQDDGGGAAAKKEGDRKLGVFIRLRASNLEVSNQALGLAVRDEPGGAIRGDVFDAEWDSRITPDITIGFVLPNAKEDRLAINFAQFDETLNIGEEGSFQNAWTSRGAFVLEDLDGDGDVDGFDCGSGDVPGGTFPCEPDGQAEALKDGAEDLNRNGRADQVRFDRSDSLLSEVQTEILTVDIDWTRRLRRSDRFTLDFSAGLRYADLSQDIDVIYRDFGSFAAYVDSQDDSFFNQGGSTLGYDADGDGLIPTINGNICTTDCLGDGWGNGNGDGQTRDNLLDIPTVDENRISAAVKTSGFGVSLGLRGEYVFKGSATRAVNPRDFQKSWAVETGFRLGLLRGDQDYSLQELVVDERDALPNFLDWDFNGDGVFGMGPNGHDFDCNGDGVVNATDWNIADCGGLNPNLPSGFSLQNLSLTGAADGILSSVLTSGEGFPDDPFGDNEINPGDPIPESERNTEVVRTVKNVRDLEGSESGEFFYSLDVDLGVRWYFSRFADVAFGARASRWFDVGNLKNVSSSTSAEELAQGDLTLNGFFVTLTVRPRF